MPIISTLALADACPADSSATATSPNAVGMGMRPVCFTPGGVAGTPHPDHSPRADSSARASCPRAARAIASSPPLAAVLESGLRATFMSLLAMAALAVADSAAAQPAAVSTVQEERILAAIKSGWSNAAPDWLARLQQDETTRACSQHNNAPPAAVGAEIRRRERASIKRPADDNFGGDWKKGERIAQSGYGLRFTDYPPAQPNGGNCYACHQLDPREVSYGTIGPSLVGYGKIRKFGAPFAKAVYDKIYNAQESQACSLMPRFGSNGILTQDQIKDLVALLMSPESPVNK